MTVTRSLPSETTLWPVLVLSLGLIVSWSLWAVGLRPLIPAQTGYLKPLLGGMARGVFWLIPCAIYLWRYWGSRWREPLGLGFPLGRAQVLRTLWVTAVVAALLVWGTGLQKGVPAAELLRQLTEHAGPNLQAPIFEELVFRGVVVSELLNWVHDQKGTRGQLRARFWGAQLFGALVFLLVHWPWWLSHQGFAGALSVSSPVFLTGLILGFVFANTRSLWGCVFLHWLNNELSLLG